MTGESVGYYMDFNGIEDLAHGPSRRLCLPGPALPPSQAPPWPARRDGVRPEQLVVSSQNHDQIGNRAKGERLSMLLKPIQLKAVAALTILSPFVPLLFQGEEWGASTPFFYFTDHQDKELGQLVAEGRRQEFETFGWANEVPNPQLPQTFAASRLDWDETRRARASASCSRWYQQIIALRASDRHPLPLPADVAYDAAERWLWFVRGDLCVVVNFASRAGRHRLARGQLDACC